MRKLGYILLPVLMYLVYGGIYDYLKPDDQPFGIILNFIALFVSCFIYSVYIEYGDVKKSKRYSWDSNTKFRNPMFDSIWIFVIIYIFVYSAACGFGWLGQYRGNDIGLCLCYTWIVCSFINLWILLRIVIRKLLEKQTLDEYYTEIKYRDSIEEETKKLKNETIKLKALLELEKYKNKKI